MILDLIVFFLIVAPLYTGYRRGFMRTAFRFFGWVVSLAASVVLTPVLSDVLREGRAGEAVQEAVSQRFSCSADSASAAADGVPEIIRGGFSSASGGASEMLASMITGAVISVISLIAVILAVRLLLGFVTRPLSARRGRYSPGGADRILGAVAGAMEGAVFVFIFLALLVAVAEYGNAAASDFILRSLDDSLIAGDLYDANLLMLITGGLFA